MPSCRLPPRGYSRADLHVHTTFSDGRASPAELLNYVAVRALCSVVAITDHDTIDGALRACDLAAAHPEIYGHLDVVIGEEVSTREGHVLGLFIREWIPPGLSARETVDEIHRQGGLAVAAHPYTSWLRWAGLRGVGDLIDSLPFDAIETRNSNFTEVFANRRAERRAAGRPQTGGSDAHFLTAVGRCFTDFPGHGAADLRRAIEAGATVPGGSCYGAPTLARYVWERVRNGGAVLPERRCFRLESSGGGLRIIVHRESAIDGAVLALDGRLDGETMSGLLEKLTLLARARVGMVLDLTGVRAMDGAGVGALVAGIRSASAEGVGFCLVALSAPAARALRAGGLLGAFPRARTLADARYRVAARAPRLDVASAALPERVAR